MAFSKKTWLQRIVENPGRRLLTPTGTTNVYDIVRSEGVVVQAGDAFSVANMNDLETRVDNAITGIENSLNWIDITSQGTWSSSLYSALTHYAKVNPGTRTVEVSCFLNAGRPDNDVIYQIPVAYQPPNITRMSLGQIYDRVKNIDILYFVDENGAIRGSHTAGAPTGISENICFHFTY